jgi:putative tricarboxylic transport membrane protein
MGFLEQLSLGFSVALNPLNILYCFLGVLFGTLIGVLPGIGPIAAMSLLLGTTFHAPPLVAIIMLAGIYYGAQYGGSTTSILVNVPGETASVMTCVDGHQMARQGRAGAALGISAFGSFIGGTLSLVGLMFLAPILVNLALRFGPPEYFSLMVFGLTIISYLGSGSMVKALLMVCFGLFLGTVGTDAVSGKLRFNLGTLYLMDGVNLVPVCMGLFGISEVLLNVEQRIGREGTITSKIKGLLPSLADWKQSIAPILRGTGLGFFLGILPGGGAILSSFVSYAMEKRLSKHPERFGKGAIEGVAGPETANNAATGGAFIPFLSLGIPANPVMALLLGALIIHGVQPGPFLLTRNPDIFWGVIASMYIGNVLLLVLNLPLIGIWVKVISVPYRIIFPLILLFCLIGAYSVNNSTNDIFAMIFFGFFGYGCKKFSFSPAPLMLAIVLGPMLEYSFCQSLKIGGGNLLIFVQRPISVAFLIVAFLSIILPLVSAMTRKKTEIDQSSTEEDL